LEKKTVIVNVETADGVKELDRLSAKFDEVYGEVLPLTGAIGELEDQLYEMAKAGQQNTDEFKAVAAEAGRLKKIIAETDMQVDALAMTSAQKLGGALGGVTSGFELVQGAMGAMGAESAKVEEALLKVQSAMAIAQGVQGLKEALPAWKALGSGAVKALTSIRGAVMATGIGLLAVAVGLVASNFDKIKGGAEKASKSFNDWLNSGTTGTKILKAYLDALVYPITLLIRAYREIEDAILGTSEASRKVEAIQKDIHQKRVKQLENERETAEKVGKATTDSIDKEIALRQAAGESTIALEKRKQEAIMNTSREALKGLVQEVKARLALGGITKEEADNLKKLIEENKKAYADAAQNLKLIDVQAKKEQNDRAKEASEKREELANEEFERESQRRKDEREAEAYWTEYLTTEDQKRADQKKAAEDRVTADAEAAAQFRAELYAWETEQALAEAKKREEAEKAAQQAKVQITKDSLQLVSDIADLFSDGDEKRAKAAFNVKKAASLAQATISTIEGTQAAFTTAAASPITTVFPAYPFVQAGLAAAFGAVKIAGIAKTKFGDSGGGASGGAGGGGSAPSLPASSPANFNIVGNSNTNQLAESLTNQPVKAYVVSGDVTSAQNLDRNRIQTGTL
jgi:hypothetical protein